MSKVSEWQDRCREAQRNDVAARNAIPAACHFEGKQIARVSDFNGFVELCGLEKGRNDFFHMSPKAALAMAQWIIETFGDKP